MGLHDDVGVLIRIRRDQSLLSAMCGHIKKVTVYKPGGRLALGTSHTGSLILDPEPPEL